MLAAAKPAKTPLRVLLVGDHEEDFFLIREMLERNRSLIAADLEHARTLEEYYIEVSIRPIRDADGKITHFVSNGRDLTERLRLEAQLLQAQKMDAIDRLAGGVAHDFNNLLTIITSYSELALDSVPHNSPLESKIQEILQAARRGAPLN